MKTLSVLFLTFASLAHAETITCTKDNSGSPLDPAYQLRDLTISYQEAAPGLDLKYLWNVTHVGRAQLSYELRQFFLPDGSLLYKSFPTNDKQFSFTLKAAGGSAGWTGAVQFTPARTPPAVDGLACEADGLPKFPKYCRPDGKRELSQLMISSVVNGEDQGVEQALLCGADSNMKTGSGCPILVAALDPSCGRHGSGSIGDINQEAPVIFNRLADQGAIIDARDPTTGETSLHKAVRQNLPEVVENLVALEADVNVQDKSGYTATMRAAEQGDLDLVTALMDGNPDLNLKNKQGQTALAIAKRGGYEKLYALLSPNKTTYTVRGKPTQDGCDPDTVRIKLNEPAIFVLDAKGLPMLRLISSSLGINLMAESNGEAKQIVVPSRKGEYPFTCGLHGGNQVTQGKIIVE
jgi:hypothetical protein